MMEFMAEHWAEFSTLGAALMVIGGIVVKLTPTKTDDKWWRLIFGKKGEG